MNNKIANIVVDYIKDLTWIDKLAGMTQVAKVSEKSGDVKVEKRFPISCQMSYEDACKGGCYNDLAPNSSKSSIVYFEDGSFSFSRREGNRLYYDSTIRLVAWLNYQRLRGGCGSTGEYIIDIIKALPGFPQNIGDMLGVMITVESQVPRGTDIFSKYTYNELQTQYNMIPYDSFAIDIQTSFYIIPECNELAPGGCLEC